jgi:hypothetical protein
MDDLEPAPPPSERRQARRFAAALPLDVSGIKAELLDFSTTGVRFVAEQPLHPGSTVAIGVRHLPDDAHPPPCKAEVVRVASFAGGFTVGAKLAPPLKPDR